MSSKKLANIGWFLIIILTSLMFFYILSNKPQINTINIDNNYIENFDLSSDNYEKIYNVCEETFAEFKNLYNLNPERYKCIKPYLDYFDKGYFKLTEEKDKKELFDLLMFFANDFYIILNENNLTQDIIFKDFELLDETTKNEKE